MLTDHFSSGRRDTSRRPERENFRAFVNLQLRPRASLMTEISTSVPVLARLGEFLTHDRESPLDPYIKWVRNPAAILLLAAVGSTLCGLCLHPQGFVLAIAITVILVIGVVWPWIAVRGVRGSIAYGRPRAREGDIVEARLVLGNRCPWSVLGLRLRGIEPDDASHPDQAADVSLSRLPGWRIRERIWDFVPPCRGVYPVSTPRIETGFPFGLRTASRVLDVSSPLVVWPRTFPVGPVPEMPGGRLSEGTWLRDKAGHAGEMMGVRPYRRGDSPRRIHWPQTARSGELIVCEFQERSTPSVQIVLDTDPRIHSGSGPGGSLEWAIRVAASLLEDWINQGADAEAVFASRVIPLHEGTVHSRRKRVLDALARIDTSDFRSLQSLLESDACRGFDRAVRIVITTDIGLMCLSDIRPRGRERERYIVLKASGFGVGHDEVDLRALPFRPWLILDEGRLIPQRLLQIGKEVALAR